MLSQTEIVSISTELLSAQGLKGCYEVVDRLLPRVLHCDYHNYLFVDLKTGSYFRRFSLGFPSEIFADHTAERARNDLIFKLARSATSGSYFHDAPPGLRSFPDRLKDWDERVKRLADKFGIIDSITVVFSFNLSQRIGLGLTLWRCRPNPEFTADDVANIGLLGPMLSTAFEKAMAIEHENINNTIASQVLAGAGQFAFLVSNNGTPLVYDGELQSCLIKVFNQAGDESGLPLCIEKIVAELIFSLERSPAHDVLSKDVIGKDGRCRIYLSRAESVLDGNPVFKVLVDCNPETFSLALLREAGLSTIQIEIVELLQGGERNAKIAQALNVSLGDISYHLEKIGAKLYAAGKTEIVARALTLYHELALKRGFSGSPSKPLENCRARVTSPDLLVDAPAAG